MATEILILYRTDRSNAPGWEERKLMPDGSLVDILAVGHNYSGQLPQIGERVPDFENLDDPGNGVTHSKEGDWQINRIQQFSSSDTEEQVVICFCKYSPVEAEWREVKRGRPVHEMLEVVEAGSK